MKTGYWFGTETCVPKLTSLLSAFYEHSYDPEYVRWIGQVGTWYVARCGSEDVGVYGIVPITYKTDGILIDVGLANNAGVDRRHRGGSLFVDLGLYAMEQFGASAYLGVSNKLAINGHLRAGWFHTYDVGFAEGVVPDDGFDSWEPECWDTYHTRNQRWRQWRYSKPGECYMVNGGIIYKVFEGVVQIMESSKFSRVDLFGVGARVGLMTPVVGSTWSRLMAAGFKERFRRHVVVRGALVACLPPRVEPCDYDVL